MASREEYIHVCQKLYETLMKDEITAIMVQLKIDRNTRSTVTDARQFIDVLEMREIISIGNVHRLVPLLKDHELDHMASLLETYMANYETALAMKEEDSLKSSKTTVERGNSDTSHSTSKNMKEDASIRPTGICEVHNAAQDVICLVCFHHLCYACAYLDHQNHQVVSKNDLETRCKTEEDSVKAEIETLEKDLHAFYNLIKFLEEKMRFPIEFKLQNFVEESSKVIQITQDRIKNSVSKITQLGVVDLQHTTEKLNEIENEIFISEGAISAQLSDVLSQLHDVNKWERKMEDNENTIHKIGQQLKNRTMQISIRPTSVSGSIARLSHGHILGAVMTSSEQMVVIRNQGNPSGFLNVACLSCFDPNILFWEFTFKCEQGPHPLVIGNTLHITPRKIEVLVACGSKIIIFQVDETKGVLYFVEKTYIDVDIPKGSHITGISPITGQMQDRGIIISDKASNMLQILDNKYKLTKRVKYPGDFQMVTCVLREDVYKYAVAAYSSSSVDLLRANRDDKMPQQDTKLRSKTSDSKTKMQPQSLFFDGTFFTVLWVSGEQTYSTGQAWRVVAYKDDGEECNECKKGTCDPNITAVSISHVKNITLLCFSNGTVDLFHTYKI